MYMDHMYYLMKFQPVLMLQLRGSIVFKMRYTFHSFTYVNSDSGCFEVSVRMIYSAEFGCNVNSSKSRVIYSSFKFPK